jgi:hypothetical protein
MRILVERSERESAEVLLTRTFAESHGIAVIETWTKAIASGRFPVQPTDIAIGAIAFVEARLRSAGRAAPLPNDYPVELRDVLGRDVQRVSLAEARARIAREGQKFIKPAEHRKRFTGFVAGDPNDARWHGCSTRLPVWIADVLAIASEWRVYVAFGRVLAVVRAPNTGTSASEPDQALTQRIADRLHRMAKGFDGVAFDMAVLADGRTVLLEVNEGYGYGAYPGTAPDAFVRPQIARQEQLLR